jgi:hypothetical protein
MAILGVSEQKRNQVNSYSGQPNKNGVREPRKITRMNNDFEYLQEEELGPNATSDQIYIKDQGNRLLQSQNSLAANTENRRQKTNEAAESAVEKNNRSAQKSPVIKRQSNRTSSKGGIKAARKLIARTKATAVGSSIFAWTFFVWPVQLVFAILSIVGLGLASAISSITESSWIASKISSALAGLASFAGIDLGIAGGIFAIPWLIVMVIGILSLATASIQYTFALLHPLSGDGAGLKIGTFLLAIVGYTVPIANLFPWVVVFVLVVWKYPR